MWHIATRGRWQYSRELMATKGPEISRVDSQPAICPQQNPASCDTGNPKDGHNSFRRNWGEGTSFFRSSGGAQNWSFPEPHSHWEGSEKTCGIFHLCSTSLDIFQKHYMTGSLPTGAQAHKDTDNGSELHVNGQKGFVIITCSGWVGMATHACSPSTQDSRKDGGQAGLHSEMRLSILYPRTACWGTSQTDFPTWQWVVILKLWHFPLLFSSHMLPHQHLLKNHSTYKSREH